MSSCGKGKLTVAPALVTTFMCSEAIARESRQASTELVDSARADGAEAETAVGAPSGTDGTSAAGTLSAASAAGSAPVSGPARASVRIATGGLDPASADGVGAAASVRSLPCGVACVEASAVEAGCELPLGPAEDGIMGSGVGAGVGALSSRPCEPTIAEVASSGSCSDSDSLQLSMSRRRRGTVGGLREASLRGATR